MINTQDDSCGVNNSPIGQHLPLAPTDALWVNLSPNLSVFDQPLLRNLAKRSCISQWQYIQEADEACAIEVALTLLHDHLKRRAQPVHLLGHGVSGAIALLYARLHPERVRSLTLLGVAEQPAVTWHAHYYVQRHLLPCAQSCVLAQLAKSLFNDERPYPAAALVQILAKDLARSPLLHSLFDIQSLPQGGVQVPLMVCGATQDAIVHPPALQEWQRWLKPGDRQWLCEQGGHFFHYFQPQQVGREVSRFWRSLAPIPQR
ncbi:MAG: alpha/beta hydrolase [Synechococcales cyanobacterium RU_4_20]|nr:alpha/beta hydrolase [Synechococcales cyanobacterium RU_4_20]NJR67664.1 alpha/beta hydrolase [Synechococcales cyanobacterium CRU_2_2]